MTPEEESVKAGSGSGLRILVALFALPVLALAVVAGIYETRGHSSGVSGISQPPAHSGRVLAVSYTGLNYYAPSDYFTGCVNWSWLQTSCYLRGHGSLSTGAQLHSDLTFITEQHLGSFLRVWISLDQLMRWNKRSGYAGYRRGALKDVDRALSQFSRHHIKVDLVLFAYSARTKSVNQFRPEALDGFHPQMRANYLRALRVFIRHVSHNRIDASTVAVMDLQTEAYYQLEFYFAHASNLGVYSACDSGGVTDSSCVDSRIIHPWLEDLYRAAHHTDPRFLYTVSDTGRLLTQDTPAQQHWISMYPVDVYDIHMYDPTPWKQQSRWRSATGLPKHWFAGEAGCGSGNEACTYNGERARRIDRWWLANLKKYGAEAVLIESHVTLWTYPNGARSQTLTPTGLALACTSDPHLQSCPPRG